MYISDAIAFQILLVTAAYLLGSINSAILVSQAMDLPDPRTLGSGNPGATNVLRTGNKFAATITLLGDLLKGFIPVVITNTLVDNAPLVAAVGLAALLGHMYPIYYRFRGGKGVATLLGVLLGMEWILGMQWIILWITVALIFRYSSLAALAATFITLCSSWVWFMNKWIPGALTIITVFIFWRHRNNISDLISGNESKLGTK